MSSGGFAARAQSAAQGHTNTNAQQGSKGQDASSKKWDQQGCIDCLRIKDPHDDEKAKVMASSCMHVGYLSA